MITITRNGKITIPHNDTRISNSSNKDNILKKFYIEGIMDISLVYKMNLKFNDGSKNYFLLDSEVVPGGTMVEWIITNDRFYKSGKATLQITASNSSGVVFKSEIMEIAIHTTVEFINPIDTTTLPFNLTA